MGSFYLYLLSSDCKDLFPSNEAANFTISLPHTIMLNGKYEVGLQDLTISNTFLNIPRGDDSVIEVTSSEREEIQRECDVTTLSLESSLKNLLQEYGIVMQYNDDRYEFLVPESIISIKFGEDLRLAIGASNIRGPHAVGDKVPRKDNPLTEECASQLLCKREHSFSTPFGPIVFTPGASILSTLHTFFNELSIDAEIAFRKNSYTLSIPVEIGSRLPHPLKKFLKIKRRTVDGGIVHFYGDNIIASYDVVVERNKQVVQKAVIPPDNYRTPQLLLTAINGALQGKAHLTHNDETKLCTITLSETTSLVLSDYISLLLGFAPVKTITSTSVGNTKLTLSPIFSNFIVYTDLVTPSLIGRKKFPILKLVQYTPSEQTHVHYSFQHVQYFRTSHREIHSVSVKLFDTTGRKLQFKSGTSALTLHFKHVPEADS